MRFLDPPRHGPIHVHFCTETIRFGAAMYRGSRMGRLAPLGDALDARQVDFEGRPFSGLAIHPDVPATLFDNAVDRGQAKTGPLSVLFGREEWLEDASLGLRVHPAPGIADRQHHVRSRPD